MEPQKMAMLLHLNMIVFLGVHVTVGDGMDVAWMVGRRHIKLDGQGYFSHGLDAPCGFIL
jgi:hypothetical protein